jgi:ribosome biogenesis protein MAK21
LGKPSFICAGLFLVSEVIKSRPLLWACIQQPEDEELEVVCSSTSDASDKPRSTSYDPTKRDPKYSNADNSCLWELVR